MRWRLANGVFDNAMLYKDITQWLRNRTFLALFIGLLALGEAVSAICMSLPGEEGRLGPVAFGFLSATMGLYGFVVIAMGFMGTSREFSNRTFELYEIAGMSLERMVLGKVVSILVQFLFGFFCIVPFMFFAFLLGGLDFGLIGQSALGMVLIFPLIALLSLCIALNVRLKRVSVPARVLLILAALWFIPGVAIRMAMGSYYLAHHGGGAWGGSAFSLFSLGNTDDLVLRIALYVQFCLWLFYLCCNSIAPPQDSREHQVKFLTFSVSATWVALVGCSNWPAMAPAAIVFLFVASCILGAILFPHRLDPPLMVVNRRKRTRWLTVRLFHYAFAPGSMGTLRTLFLFYLLSVVTYLAVTESGPSPQELASSSRPLQAPFFLFLSPVLLMPFGFARKRYKTLRAVTICYWALVGVGLLILYSIAESPGFRRPGSGYDGHVRAWAALGSLMLSPVSSWVVGTVYRPGFESSLGSYRLVSGAIGLIGLLWIARRCRRAERQG
ncbi:hypothetical protein JW916_15915 [Candidatus Sumerlaeota bacterium]|nr:hypothetical protein [Candidatus Sumerlaeota bacterium]